MPSDSRSSKSSSGTVILADSKSAAAQLLFPSLLRRSLANTVMSPSPDCRPYLPSYKELILRWPN